MGTKLDDDGYAGAIESVRAAIQRGASIR